MEIFIGCTICVGLLAFGLYVHNQERKDKKQQAALEYMFYTAPFLMKPHYDAELQAYAERNGVPVGSPVVQYLNGALWGENDTNESQRQRDREVILRRYLPSDTEVAEFRGSMAKEFANGHRSCLVYRDGKMLVLYPSLGSLLQRKKVGIPIDDIQVFARIGDFYVTSGTRGGGGGGSSLSGAFLGGLLAGPAGAIIASRKETEEVSSWDEENDERETVLLFSDGDGQKCAFFDSESYMVFCRMIPEKSADVVGRSESQAQAASASKEDEVYKKLRELKQLKEEGVIDSEEYSAKKEDLLRRL